MRRVKISATVDSELLHVVDDYVSQHQGLDRSKVIDEALALWYAREQERAMRAQFEAPQSPVEREERVAWRKLQAAAVERIFGSRSSPESTVDSSQSKGS
ncbi:MAG: hypothetical protein HY690_00570 [Chloroflexi bacterium]|nr:hypothetical protein [Chloroflexota bacterium]